MSESQIQLAAITQVIALSSLPPVNYADLQLLLTQLDHPKHYYFAVAQDSELVSILQYLQLPIILVSHNNMTLMSKYLFDFNKQLFKSKLKSAIFACAQLALFASGHSRLINPINQTTPSIISCCMPFKLRQHQLSQCQILLCQREPCIQQHNRRDLLKQLRHIIHQLADQQHNWCLLTLTDCLGICSPGGAAIIHQDYHLGLAPLQLRFIEQISLHQWHTILTGLKQQQPLITLISPQFIVGATL
ncbi:hypothetical protein GLP14_09235 [Photobacterium carnosum]|uniref:hypothetical protein n=1 Tax=Photobacterium carnosum TaxID=2023717 RepID=UPI001E3EBD04|nr:hypothetical protein [Photobacterium carnosum]MCD9523002.1 hypothetical protein [Photobacterium carnosum]